MAGCFAIGPVERGAFGRSRGHFRVIGVPRHAQPVAAAALGDAG